MQIVPIRDLRNTNEISERCRQSGEPIFITKNGYGDMDAYDEGYTDGYNAAYEELGITPVDKDDAEYEYDYADHDEGALNPKQQFIYDALMRK